MSHYRALIEKLSVRHVEREDFEELYTLSTEALNELSAEDREEVDRHAAVVAAVALSRSKGNAKGAVDTLKSLERQLVSSKFDIVNLRPSLPVGGPRIAPMQTRRTSTLSVILYTVVAFVLFIFLVGLMSRRC